MARLIAKSKFPGERSEATMEMIAPVPSPEREPARMTGLAVSVVVLMTGPQTTSSVKGAGEEES